jgi:hypothetical protein
VQSPPHSQDPPAQTGAQKPPSQNPLVQFSPELHGAPAHCGAVFTAQVRPTRRRSEHASVTQRPLPLLDWQQIGWLSGQKTPGKALPQGMLALPAQGLASASRSPSRVSAPAAPPAASDRKKFRRVACLPTLRARSSNLRPSIVCRLLVSLRRIDGSVAGMRHGS